MLALGLADAAPVDDPEVVPVKDPEGAAVDDALVPFDAPADGLVVFPPAVALPLPTSPTPYDFVDAPSSAHDRPPKTCAMNVSSCHAER